MLNQITEMNYVSRKNASGVKTLLQKMRFKKRIESGVFAKNCVQKESAVRASRNICAMLYISLESPWRELLNGIFHFKIGSLVFEWRRVEHGMKSWKNRDVTRFCALLGHPIKQPQKVMAYTEINF